MRGDGEEGRQRPSGGRKAQSSWEAEQLTRQSAETADSGRDQRGRIKRPTRGAAATREDSGAPPPPTTFSPGTPPPPGHCTRWQNYAEELFSCGISCSRIHRRQTGWAMLVVSVQRDVCSLSELAGLKMVL